MKPREIRRRKTRHRATDQRLSCAESQRRGEGRAGSEETTSEPSQTEKGLHRRELSVLQEQQWGHTRRRTLRSWKKGVSGPDTHPVAALPPTDPQAGGAKAAPQGGAGNPEPETTKSASVHADPREHPRLGTAAPPPGQSPNADQPRSRGRSPHPQVFARTRTGKTQTDNRLLGSDTLRTSR